MKKNIAHFLSGVYRAALKISQSSYPEGSARVRKAGVRVISVGNITWGGTGKTPLVAMLSADEKYRKKGIEAGAICAIDKADFDFAVFDELKRQIAGN